MSGKTSDEKESIALRLTTGAGVIGMCVAAMVQMLGTDIGQVQNPPLSLGILAFSVAIPLIGLDLYATYCEIVCDRLMPSRGRSLARLLGLSLGLAGFDTLFWHFNVVAGWASLLAGGIAVYFWRRFYVRLRAAKEKE